MPPAEGRPLASPLPGGRPHPALPFRGLPACAPGHSTGVFYATIFTITMSYEGRMVPARGVLRKSFSAGFRLRRRHQGRHQFADLLMPRRGVGKVHLSVHLVDVPAPFTAPREIARRDDVPDDPLDGPLGDANSTRHVPH